MLVLIMKGTRRCNLRCTYCRSWSDEPDQVMPFDVLAKATYGALAAPGVRSVEFVWHGGETTMRPLSFYRQALWLQQRFRRPGQKIANSLQTNGTHLTAEWLDFLKRYRFQVGVSLDGTPEVHDRRRVDIAGQPTSARAREGLAKLQAAGVANGVLVVVDQEIIDVGAQRLLDYLLEIGVRQVGLLNVVPEGNLEERTVTGSYLEYSRYVEFMRQLFHLWWPRYAERIDFREISDLLHKLQGRRGTYCIYAGNCMGSFLTIEPMGEISACDRFQGDDTYRYGSVREMDLADLPASPSLVRLHSQTAEELERTEGCPWYAICQGGCPHDRYVRTQRGTPHDEGCCGLAPLLADMAVTLRDHPEA